MEKSMVSWKPLSKEGRIWLIFLSILGIVIAVSTVYVAVATYQSQHTLPAHYAEMSGKYFMQP
jgi:hypothetical protein